MLSPHGRRQRGRLVVPDGIVHIAARGFEAREAGVDVDVFGKAFAQAEQRVVVTADTDFGELAFRSRLPADCGVILIRLDSTNPAADNEVVIEALISRDSWSGIFAVVERDRLRLRPLPSAGTKSSLE